MVDDAIEKLKELNLELTKLNRSVQLDVTANIDIEKIKRQIANDMKRELQGRSSYGVGI